MVLLFSVLLLLTFELSESDKSSRFSQTSPVYLILRNINLLTNKADLEFDILDFSLYLPRIKPILQNRIETFNGQPKTSDTDLKKLQGLIANAKPNSMATSFNEEVVKPLSINTTHTSKFIESAAAPSELNFESMIGPQKFRNTNVSHYGSSTTHHVPNIEFHENDLKKETNIHLGHEFSPRQLLIDNIIYHDNRTIVRQKQQQKAKIIGNSEVSVDRYPIKTDLTHSSEPIDNLLNDGTRYYQYANVDGNGTYKAGVRKGNKLHSVESHERFSNDFGLFQKIVRWSDKKGGYGEHYWDLGHVKPTL